ncbi:MAG TPA: hypothetical protein QF772_01075 [Nitrospinaceae bacterium]|jgi:hypothetical protein|nr:hypothetical protein [Nitrospinaceae bacterium]
MSNHKGSEGTVHVGTDAVAEIKSYSFNETANTIDDTTIGNDAKTFKAGQTQFSGSVDVFWDESDTAQVAMTVGAEITIKFYPEGGDSTDKYYTGTAIVTSIDRSATIDGMVEASYGLTGSGSLTLSTV